MKQNEILKKKEEVILVVDDYPYNLTAVDAILSEEGYKNILMASSGREALSVINEKAAVDLVLLDIMMPDMDGFEVCNTLQQTKETSGIPVIMITAKISAKDLKKGFEVGAIDYIGKPFDRLELIARVQSALKLKKSIDDLKTKNIELSSLVQQNGHDIKTSITQLTSLLPIIEDKESDPKSKELLNVCIQNASHIKNQVLSTRWLCLNSDETVFDIKETNLYDVIASALNDYQTVFGDNFIRVENKTNKEIIVLADGLQLKEVFANLITNAINFMKGGGELTLDARENEDGVATISVKDTGIGPDEKQKIHLYDEFYKADQSGHEPGSSDLDLGLAICKRIVEKHGGTIWAKSSGTGNGTTFCFTILTKSKIDHLAVKAA